MCARYVKMKIKLCIVILAVCLLFSGCGLWMDGSYHSVTPYVIEQVPEQQDAVAVEDSTQIPDALIHLVEQGIATAVILCPKLSAEELESSMQDVVDSLINTDALCAYAVSEFQYEIGERNGTNAVAVQIVYKHTVTEIAQIQYVDDMTQAQEIIGQALTTCEVGVVVRVAAYETVDFTQFVQDYVDSNPQLCMQMPQVAVVLYPESGVDRVAELTFTYQTSRDALRNMQDTVQKVFSSAMNYVDTDAGLVEQYSQLYSFLMGRDTYTVQTSLTPSYSLLKHGVGDSKAFAVVYAAMCRQSGLDCNVVSGTYGGESRCWNVMKIGGTNYYLDLLKCSSSGGFSLKTADQMEEYVWDYSAY